MLTLHTGIWCRSILSSPSVFCRSRSPVRVRRTGTTHSFCSQGSRHMATALAVFWSSVGEGPSAKPHTARNIYQCCIGPLHMHIHHVCRSVGWLSVWSSSMIILPTDICMLTQEYQRHMQLSSGFVTCRFCTGIDRPTKLLHCPGQHCLGCHPLYRVQLRSILLSVCVACMPRAKPRRLPGGWVPTIAAPASKAEVHRIVVIGVVTSLHGDIQQPNWFL